MDALYISMSLFNSGAWQSHQEQIMKICTLPLPSVLLTAAVKRHFQVEAG